MSLPGSGKFYRGETVPITVNVLGAPDMTGWHMTFVVIDSTGAVVLTLTPVGNTPIVGSAFATLTHANTLSLAPGTYTYQWWRNDAGAEGMITDGILEAEDSKIAA